MITGWGTLTSPVPSILLARHASLMQVEGGVSGKRHLWDHKNPYYGCWGAGLREEQD